MRKKAIILCSGGIDSVTTAYFAKKNLGYKEIIILFFDYGQKSLISERKCSKMCAEDLKTEFKEMAIPELNRLSSSLINNPGKAEKLSRKDLKNTREESKKWYVPARNLIFLSYAISLAESLFMKNGEKTDIFTGFKCEGKESYPDTTKKFVELINNLSQDSTESQPKIIAPLINKDKEDIIKLGSKLGVDFTKTFSCYQDVKHCGTCLACALRKTGFYWAGIQDPSEYQENKNY